MGAAPHEGIPGVDDLETMAPWQLITQSRELCTGVQVRSLGFLWGLKATRPPPRRRSRLALTPTQRQGNFPNGESRAVLLIPCDGNHAGHPRTATTSLVDATTSVNAPRWPCHGKPGGPQSVALQAAGRALFSAEWLNALRS